MQRSSENSTAGLRRGLLTRVLPNGGWDPLLQLLLFVGADLAYESVRGLVEGRADQAFANAHGIIAVEQSLGLFFEPSIQAWALNHHRWLVEAANWAYMNSHFVITTAFLVWLYVARNDSFYFVRNLFMIAMGLALVGYLLFPTAPPRMLPIYGFIDTIADVSGVENDSALVRMFINPFAAIPSMHVAFSLMVAAPAVMLVRAWFFRLIWALYPALVLFVVVVTANHYWLDALAGVTVAVTAALAARGFARARPTVWSWRSAKTSEVTI